MSFVTRPEFRSPACSKAKRGTLHQIPHQRVVGQDEAVQGLANAVIRARSRLKAPNHPFRPPRATTSGGHSTAEQSSAGPIHTPHPLVDAAG